METNEEKINLSQTVFDTFLQRFSLKNRENEKKKDVSLKDFRE